MSALDRLSIEGFKSIRKLDEFPLRRLNVLIGANGSGKSNFISFFRFLRELVDQRLQLYTRKQGGADSFLHLGPKVTKQISASLKFGMNGYRFAIVTTQQNEFVLEDETVYYFPTRSGIPYPLGSGHLEAKLKDKKDTPGRMSSLGPNYYVFTAITSWIVYHFHDTSDSAGVRREGEIHVNETLATDASNLAAFLYRLQRTHRSTYEEIREVIRLAAPFFDDFNLRSIPGAEDRIQLEWRQTDSDHPFRANQLSDGTLRFICLATALLQPSPPSTMLFDEPELGLHPYALSLLAGLFQQAAKRTQIIVSTQSAPLLSEFEPQDVIVVEREHGESTFHRLRPEDLSEWLEEYSLGELWLKNVLGGRPRREDTPTPA